MANMDDAFDDAYRTARIEAGDDPATLPNPYGRSLPGHDPTPYPSSAKTQHGGDSGGGFMPENDAIEGGGFMPDDEDEGVEGGGFLPEEADPSPGPSSSYTPASDVPKPATIPLSAIPEALTNLGLDASDAHVLQLFSDTAYTPKSASSRRRVPGETVEKVVARQEFKQVAAILLEEQRLQQSRTEEENPAASGSSTRRKRKGVEQEEADPEDDSVDDGRRRTRRPTRKAAVQGRVKAAKIVARSEDDGEADDAGGRGGGGFMMDDADDSADEFRADDDDDNILGGGTSRRRRRGANLDMGSDLSDDVGSDDVGRRRRRKPTRRNDDEDDQDELSGLDSAESEDLEDGTPSSRRRKGKSSSTKSSSGGGIRTTKHLNPLQRDTVSTVYEMLISRLPSNPTFPIPASRRIGLTELTAIVASLGEKIPEKELEEMLEQGSKLFAPASTSASSMQDVEGEDGGKGGERPSTQALKGLDSAQGLSGHTVGLNEFAGIMVHNRLV